MQVIRLALACTRPFARYLSSVLGRSYETQHCSMARALEVIGERWTLLILRDAMFRGYTRFSEFQRSLGIATNVLAKRLSGLVDDGIFHLAETDGEHPRYLLTERGVDLVPVMIAATQWGDKWIRPGPIDFIDEKSHAMAAVEIVSADSRETIEPASVRVRLRRST